MPERRLQYEVLVVGAGPAGIAAACVAAEAGKRTALVDQLPGPGGQIWRGNDPGSKPRLARRWLDRLERSGATRLLGTAVFAAPGPECLLAEGLHGPLELGWQRLVLATGARELFLPFPGWTLPGLVGAGGLQALVKAGWPVAGQRVVVVGSGPLLIAAAAQLRRHGARVVCIVEQAEFGRLSRFALSLCALAPGKLIEGFAYRARLPAVRYHTGCWPVTVRGRDHVEAITLTDGRSTWEEPTDLVACGFGLVPNLELPWLLGCRIERGVVWTNDTQETSVRGAFCAGEPAGIGGVDLALATGQIAGYAAAGRPGQAHALNPSRRRARRFAALLNAAFALRPEVKRLMAPETIVCRCEDVRWRDLQGFGDWHDAKLHTRCGMGACQGRTCGDALRVLAGWENAAVRPPLLPVRVRALAVLSATPMEPTPNTTAGPE